MSNSWEHYKDYLYERTGTANPAVVDEIDPATGESRYPDLLHYEEWIRDQEEEYWERRAEMDRLDRLGY